MKCKECSCCRLGWFSSRPNSYVCIGVPEPFVIDNIDVECTEYPERRTPKPKNLVTENISTKDAIDHFKYGISHDIFKEPVTTYAKMAIESLEKQIPKEHHHTHIFEISDKARLSICPNCLAVIITSSKEFPKFCTWCGQAIKWDD